MKKIVPTQEGYPVALLFSEHSLTAAVEKTQKQGALLAIDEINDQGGIHGVPIVPVSVSIGPDPEDYKNAAQKCIEQYSVDILFGTHTSNTRKAVLPLIENRNALLFYSTLYEGFEYSQNCIYTGAAPNQNIAQLAEYAIKNYGKRVMFIGNNYVYAFESNRIMKELFESVGGEVIENMYFPFGSKRNQFKSAMQVAENLKPNVIYSTVVGKDTIELYEAFGLSSLNSQETPIISVATNETDIKAMSAHAAKGHLVCAPYFQSLISPENSRFVDAYQDKFGKDAPITAGAEASYFQVHLFAQAANSVTDLTVEALVNSIPTLSFAAPQGVVHVDAANNHTYLSSRIAKVNEFRQFEIINEVEEMIKPVPYMLQFTNTLANA